MLDLLQRAKDAQKIIANLKDSARNEVLCAMSEAILAQKEAILRANECDIKNAQDSELPTPMLERLRLDSRKISSIANALCEISALKSPLGRVLDGWENHCGLKINKITVPIGVIAMIYEARPNVTSDSFALCFKSGNVCILKGGKEALHSNRAIVGILHEVLGRFSLPRESLCFIDSREATESLLKCDKFIDLVIPRGGENLIKFVAQNSTIPVIKHDKGVCHIYIDKNCDENIALNVALNAKISNSAACNSVESILIHKDCAILPRLVAHLQDNGVEIRAFGDLSRKFGLKSIDESAFYLEYGAKTLNLALIDSLDSAIAHINKFGSQHSDAIITRDYCASQKFVREVDSACVFVNASTRFSDGGEFGFGAEIGISTSKLHARGPMGIESLVSYKYEIFGNGEIRK